ncbi:hypothetical protein HDU96_001226, partial [Phlyctochytrium bullatum]
VPAHDVHLVHAARKAATEAEEQATKTSSETPETRSRVHVIKVSEWGNFIPALNQLLWAAAKLGMSRILFRSIEVAGLQKGEVEELVRAMDEDTLVVGKCLEGHDFRAGEAPSTTVELNGVTTPWNTLAVWDVEKLALTGFLMVAEGFETFGTVGGVEEVSVIALHQRLRAASSKAKLIKFVHGDGDQAVASGWNASWSHDPAREAWHRRKMESKVSRPAKHVELLFGGSSVPLPPPTHVTARAEAGDEADAAKRRKVDGDVRMGVAGWVEHAVVRVASGGAK